VITPRASIRIDARPEAVIDFIADPANARRWMVALEESVPLTPGPIATGSRFREVFTAAGQRVEMICEIVDYAPGRRYAWRSVGDGPTDYGGSFVAEPVDGGTELSYEGWATTRNGLQRREDAWARQAQREAEAEVARIKAAVEGRPAEG
jgi:uncharacterized protein YndB with AHSA1/START domain